MKKLLSASLLLLAVFACTPTLEPENGKEPEQTTEIAVQSIVLNTTSLSLQPGETFALSGTVQPDNATIHSVSWKSSNDNVATVSQEGNVTAVSEGNCVITVAVDGVKAECDVTVAIVRIPVTSVSLSQTSADLLVGESLQLNATVLPDNATDKTVTWTTSNADVASVDNGLVTALNAGDAVITASSGNYSATCTLNVSVPFSYGGMCMEAITGGTVSISNPNGLTIEYKVENNDWESANSTTISIKANANERIWFRGNNESYAKGNSEDGYKPTVFDCHNGEFYLYGNLMSLIYGDEYESKTAITGEYAFYKLFFQNSNIINHPNLEIELPATTLSASCYRNMFYSCTKLTQAPKLPAKKLEEACYASMFCYCSSLKEAPVMAAEEMAYMSCTWMMMRSGIEEAPELPAMILARSCYEFMFMECPNLKKGPSVLPATELTSTCYTGMFQRCEKLEEAPVLPATELKYSCYSHMFNGCTSLKKAPKLPATKLAEACYQRMFGNSGLEETPELPAMDLEVMCYQYMFEGCTSLEKAPVLPATTLNYWCYEKMFNGCSSLNYIKMMGTQVKKDTWSGYKLVDLTNDNISSYCTEWVNGVATNGTFVKNPDAKWEVRGVNGIPEGWIVE